MFVWGLSSHSRIFHSYGDVTIAGEGLQILTCARHSWPLSSEGSLACHTYCGTGHPYNGHLRGPVTLIPVAERLAVELSLHVLKSVVAGIWTSILPHARRMRLPTAPPPRQLYDICISIICHLIFHYRIISFWFWKTYYPGVLRHLKVVRSCVWLHCTDLSFQDFEWYSSLDSTPKIKPYWIKTLL